MPQNDTVLTLVKTPLMTHGLAARLPRDLTVAEAVEQIRKTPAKTPADTRLIAQLTREVGSRHDFLALVKPTGETAKVPPTTKLEELAIIPREVRTSFGVEVLQVASFEVQSYAPLGNVSC